MSLIMATALVAFLVKRETVLDWASEHINEEKSSDAYEKARQHIEDNLDISKYILIATTTVTVLVTAFGIFYRCSMKSDRDGNYNRIRY
mmetsp:Transcript_26547/g.26419  ORF Transcript_26547/g.26419 Transcript_26547/m.26419 type:complete len:89 (+) Transcript_26547:265-531(+)